MIINYAQSWLLLATFAMVSVGRAQFKILYGPNRLISVLLGLRCDDMR